MKLEFYKYQGTGNDFIIVDNRDNKINLSKDDIAKICHRRFGIGADGFMLLENHDKLDFNMRYYNSDGNESTMCGNGGRCLVAFAKHLNIINTTTKFNSIDGEHKAEIINDIISLEMQNVSTIHKVNNNFFLNTGSPHYVLFKTKVNEIDVYNRGREIRYSKEFSPDGTNVNFVENIDGKLFVRTYERGVEDETYSCGTGVTASAIAANSYLETDKNSFNISTKGGELNVRFTKVDKNNFKDIWLTGPAKLVFKGSIDI